MEGLVVIRSITTQSRGRKREGMERSAIQKCLWEVHLNKDLNSSEGVSHANCSAIWFFKIEFIKLT